MGEGKILQSPHHHYNTATTPPALPWRCSWGAVGSRRSMRAHPWGCTPLALLLEGCLGMRSARGVPALPSFWRAVKTRCALCAPWPCSWRAVGRRHALGCTPLSRCRHRRRRSRRRCRCRCGYCRCCCCCCYGCGCGCGWGLGLGSWVLGLESWVLGVGCWVLLLC